MRIRTVSFALIALGTAAISQSPKQQWVKTFPVNKKILSTTGKSDYFVLHPGYTLELHGGKTHLVVAVKNDTEVVDGVNTRVVVERETLNGNLVEISRNFFAIDNSTGDVYYFGEDVDIYKNGKIVSHDGAWRSGVNGAKFGMALPGKATLDQAYYQEIAPEVAMDRAIIVGTAVTLKTLAGTFENCLKVAETTPLEPGQTGYKIYAPGIGLTRDGDLTLVKKP